MAAIFGLAIPMWNSTRQMLGLESRIGTLIVIVAILVGYVFTTIVPLFYFALYRNEGGLPLSRNMRWIAATAAAVIGILVLTRIPGWIRSFRGDSVLDTAARQWAIDDTSTVLNMIGDLASMLLLIALYRLAGETSSDSGGATSKLLRYSTKLAVIAGGFVAICCLVGLGATPWVYSYIRDRAFELGIPKERWAFSRLAIDRVSTALSAISPYVAPFVVWHGARNRVTNARSSPDHVIQ